MDAYKRYHQIPLAEENQDKVSFIISEGTFCYVVMPFGLKNAGATYQRLMDKVFSAQVGRNVEVKAKKFEWDEECVKAFDYLKKYFAELPILVKPSAGEQLYVYLSATEAAVSSVLIRQLGTEQSPVYYISHALKGAELRYMVVEKLALALVTTARRTAIKARDLADFLAETIHVEVEDLWKVYVDGSSTNEGSGVGVLLISPKGDEVKLAVRLDFRASNNEAEYEAVLNERLMKYTKAAEAAKELFTELVFKQIPREENEGADTLVKMASSLHS
ncbi:uncharacterized protein [Primulina huaijiensis]|uniref:uncharacterized protein n=1 Tax=Primulina huaijiensis TaxID=1492673 RepID=UPI003CC73C20